MKKANFFPVLYMFIITAVLSAILIIFGNLTRQRVQANQRLDFEKAVLSVLPIDIDTQTAPSLEIHKIFTEQITQPENAGGAYTIQKEGQIIAYALPIDGKGFWAPIKGLIGIGPDKKQLLGIAFYEQSETPGLGAEIAQPQFCDQFKIENNKVLADTDKPLKIARPGSELTKNQVHAVTGATQTSTRLEKLINEDIIRWRQALNSGGTK